MHNPENARQVAVVQTRIRQFVGRAYPRLESELSKLSSDALVDLARFVADAQTEVSRAKVQPWRR